MAARVRLFEKEANLIYILPSSKMTTLLSQGALSEEEGVYAHAAWRFAAHFINRMGSEYYSLRGILDMRNEHHAGLMAALKRRLAENTYTEHSIGEVIMGNLVMVHSSACHQSQRVGSCATLACVLRSSCSTKTLHSSTRLLRTTSSRTARRPGRPTTR